MNKLSISQSNFNFNIKSNKSSNKTKIEEYSKTEIPVMAKTSTAINNEIKAFERIKKKHSEIDELTIINYSLKEAIKYNYEKQQRKNKYFFKGLIFLFLSVIFFIISKIIYSL